MLLTGAAVGAVALALALLAALVWRERDVAEVRRGIAAYGGGQHAEAARMFEEARTDLDDQQGALWLDRGVALAALEKNDEAGAALRRAAGTAKTAREIRSEAHFALGNLALRQHHDYEALEEYRQALRLWPENRDAAWNLSLARRRLEIDGCKLVGPPEVQMVSGQESDEIAGEVVEAPRTAEAGPLEGLVGQVGYGPEGSRPEDAGWSWQGAEYAGEAEEGGGERYAGKLKATLPGRYDMAYRFRQPGGGWAYCDQNGSSEGGYQPEQAGKLVVEPPGNRCQILGPSWLIAPPGATSDRVELAVAVAEGDQIGEVQMGYGAQGSNPSAGEGGEGWQWSATEGLGVTLEQAGSVPAGSPRFGGRLRAGEAGRYDFAFRWRPQGEQEWIHCDLNGSDDGYGEQAAGDFVVRRLEGAACVLDRPPRTQAAPGQATESIRGLVAAEVASERVVQAELGYGPEGSEPDDEAWNWVAMEGAAEAPEDWAGFEASLTAPEQEGMYKYAIRLAREGEEPPWNYCDLDGMANGYQATMAGELLVQQGENNSQDEQNDEEEDEEQEEPDEPDEAEPQEPEQEPEQQELPQDMESVLDALQQNEKTFLPPRVQRQVGEDW
jgi:hypothetical protein